MDWEGCLLNYSHPGASYIMDRFGSWIPLIQALWIIIEEYRALIMAVNRWFPNVCSSLKAVPTGCSVRDWYKFPHRDITGINSVFPIQTKTFFIITNHLKSAESPQHEYLPDKPFLSTGWLPPFYGWGQPGIFPTKSFLDCIIPHRPFMGLCLPHLKKEFFQPSGELISSHHYIQEDTALFDVSAAIHEAGTCEKI